MASHCTVYVKNKVSSCKHCSWFWHIGASPNLKFTTYGVLFVFTEAGWCPVWRTYFSTPSPRAKRLSRSSSSSLWVNNTFIPPLSRCALFWLSMAYVDIHINTLCLAPGLYYLESTFDFSQVNLGEWHGSTKEESRVSPAECRVKFKRRWRIFLRNRTKYSRCYTDVIITEQHAFFTLKLNYFGALITIKSYNSEVVPEDSMITSLH